MLAVLRNVEWTFDARSGNQPAARGIARSIARGIARGIARSLSPLNIRTLSERLWTSELRISRGVAAVTSFVV